MKLEWKCDSLSGFFFSAFSTLILSVVQVNYIVFTKKSLNSKQVSNRIINIYCIIVWRLFCWKRVRVKSNSYTCTVRNWSAGNKYQHSRACPLMYCEIIIIRGARIFVVFVDRSIHEFKTRRNFIPTNASYHVSVPYITTCVGAFPADICGMNVYYNQVSDKLNP